MTVERTRLVHFKCDGIDGANEQCPHTLDTQQFQFSKAFAALKAAGWVARKNGEEWKHYCGRCWTLMELGVPAPADTKGNSN